MKPVSPRVALSQPRRLDIRLHLESQVQDLSQQDIHLLLQVVARHGVVCLVEQPLTPRELRDFTARWGEVVELPHGLALGNQEPGLPSITRVGNIRPDGTIIHAVRFAEYWHHDGDFWASGANHILNFNASVRVPALGGNTGFLDSVLAYEQLHQAQKMELERAFICVRASEISDFKLASPHELPPDVRHPVVLRHPLTRTPALYLPDSASGIQREDGTQWGTVDALIESVVRVQGIVEHVWSEGDLVIMDNLQVMHRGMGGYGDHPRLMYRCQARVRRG
jgi:taurine dioxygenase